MKKKRKSFNGGSSTWLTNFAKKEVWKEESWNKVEERGKEILYKEQKGIGGLKGLRIGEMMNVGIEIKRSV